MYVCVCACMFVFSLSTNASTWCYSEPLFCGTLSYLSLCSFQWTVGFFRVSTFLIFVYPQSVWETFLQGGDCVTKWKEPFI